MKICTNPLCECKDPQPLENYHKDAKSPDGHQSQCRECRNRMQRDKKLAMSDPEIIEQNIRLARGKQKAQDVNRIERKSFREDARYQNAIAGYSREIASVLDGFKFHDIPPLSIQKSHAMGVLHLTDLHFNELVDLPQNKYDYEIAGKRLRMYVHKATKYFKVEGITDVFIAFTADLMNSDRRLDELLAMGTNRARATALSVDILSQLIREVAKDFNVTVGWINGNEGRVGQMLGYQDEIASDNYDETIMRILSLMFKDTERVNFVKPTDPLELVVNVCGHNILLLHGHQVEKDYTKSVAKIKAKYANRGIKIRYMLLGHIHEAYISDMFARGSSPVGDNTYSDKALNLTGRASQNAHIVHANGNIDSFKIDLQECNGVAGYETDKHLWSFNIKSIAKARPHTHVHTIEVII